ncbi:LysR family transcriptional regulator [Leeia oryzae]|uniref:LysR family transcriptional regulator n=1 Tax=Leeia oryzae TaxID=356662 RepID=UPI00036799A5|nr:LysR family transcriptional regulator [Leeia oryzae]
MQIPLIDPLLLKSFIAVVESGSFTRAGERVFLSQSTVSQQLKRLEDQLGCSLLDRSGRYIVPTLQGERLLEHARQILKLMGTMVEELQEGDVQGEIRLGVPEDFASHPLTPLLGRFIQTSRRIRLSVTSDLSHRLWQQFCDGEHDLVLIKQRPGHTIGQACWPEPLSWIDSADTPAYGQDPIPLVVFPAGGLYRDEMMHAIESAGKRWRICYSSTSLESIRAAVSHGLGISLIPTRLALPSHQCLTAAQGFPALPALELVLHVRRDAPHTVQQLASQLQALCQQVMSA